MAKIAPDLAWLMREWSSIDFKGPSAGRAKPQLAALLEVAAAARHLVNEDRNRKPGEIHCSWVEACDRTTRALARLDKVSGRKGDK